MNNLVSLIIPAYQVEDWIERCLCSVRNQTYRNIEVIIVDDGSSDRTGTVCDAFSAIDGRFAVVHQSNEGVSAARNKGFALARGKYVCFIDADDYLNPDYVNMLYSAMENDCVQMAICGYTEEFEDGTVKNVLKGGEGIHKSHEIMEALFFHDYVGRSLWNKMLDSEVIRNAGLQFSKEFLVGEDMLFLMLYLRQIDAAAIIEKSGYHYLWRNQSAMQKKKWDAEYYRSRISWLKAIDAAGQLLKEESAGCQKTFSQYKVLVHYRILCESISLQGDADKGKRHELERKMKACVRKHGIPVILSGKLPLVTAAGMLLCCISPKLQVAAAKRRRKRYGRKQKGEIC